MSEGRFKRVAERNRREVAFVLDGKPATALEGDTLLVAVLTQASTVRQSEFGDGERAGFCMMGACQDCWMWTADGGRIRACTSVIAAGMSVCTSPVDSTLWPISA